MEVIKVENKSEIMQEAMKYLNGLGCNLSEAHKHQFLNICSSFGLNPFLREIYAIPYNNNFNIIVGYEVYLKRAESSGRLAGWKAWCENKGGELKGCVEILRKDWTCPFYHEVSFKEYTSGKNLWLTKPETMIKKVAIAQGFRMCFPCELGGIPYTREELEAQDSITKDKEVKIPQNDTSSNAKALMDTLKSLGLEVLEIKKFCEKHKITSVNPESIEAILGREDLKTLVEDFKSEHSTKEVAVVEESI
ncbi:phage recombination protein Bet [Helicobacter sp.]|uniref:phage recombination protein Bet n=1 Tax=Helicobacter sp. TaxID=218 RepID=UPI0025B7C55C|nr:phage recombination protein Bet [Helicobacter sp.]MCI5969151.1 phage recombination protein Bet [Helicobacter sp.]